MSNDKDIYTAAQGVDEYFEDKLWIAIRCIYLFNKKENGKNVYEERIVVFCGNTIKECYDKATKESEEYSKSLSSYNCFKLNMHKTLDGYEQDGDNLIDGYEIWSELYESDLNIDDFYNERYEKFRYNPD